MSIIYYDAILDSFVSHNKCIPYKIKKGYTHRVDATYWNGYWHKAYRVLDIDEKSIQKMDNEQVSPYIKGILKYEDKLLTIIDIDKLLN